MDPITRQAIAVAAGAGGAEATYVDDVFSTFLYKGNNSTQTINNGIDLSGEGGLVWQKGRSMSSGSWSIPHLLFDTERGARKLISSNTYAAESTPVYGVSSFNSNGFSLNDSYTHSNSSVIDGGYCSWTFRKAPGFFDVVTYTGTGSVQNISHSLGSTPGMIMVKHLSGSSDWSVWHRSLSVPQRSQLRLNTTGAEITTNTDYWGNTAPTSTQFTVGNSQLTGGNGQTYVAYLFAHDDQSFGTDSDEAIIKCGSYNADSNGHYTVDLGFEPQFLLVKSTSAGSWFLIDNMRDMATASGSLLRAESSNAETTYSGEGYLVLQPNGFKSTLNLLGASQTFVYMAIRRPHKPPTAGTDVFGIDNGSSSSTIPNWDSGFPVDMSFFFSTFGGYNFGNAARILGSKWLKTDLPDALAGDGSIVWDSNEGYGTGYQSHWYSHMFKRAPGFFDVVTWTGNGTQGRTILHNLGVAPELIIVKSRSNAIGWPTWQKYGTDDSTYGRKTLMLNTNAAESLTGWFTTTEPTSTVFSLSSNNQINSGSGYTYIGYLFATLSGISKVGSYTGTGYSVNVDCGFAAGARFVLIKRTDSSGDWYVWDTLRGIVSGNDPYKLLNSNAAQVTNTDYIDPLNAGFTVTSSAPAALNASGGTYLFLAIA